MTIDSLNGRWHWSTYIAGFLCFASLGYAWGWHEGLCFGVKYDLPNFYKEHCE